MVGSQAVEAKFPPKFSAFQEILKKGDLLATLVALILHLETFQWRKKIKWHDIIKRVTVRPQTMQNHVEEASVDEVTCFINAMTNSLSRFHIVGFFLCIKKGGLKCTYRERGKGLAYECNIDDPNTVVVR